jgi:ABC-type antimicrobial peptide transport system permease subunit
MDTIREFIINETYAKKLGFQPPEEAVGKILNKKYPIVGVVKDFHVQSFRNKIPPVAISYLKSNLTCFSLKLATKGKGAAHFGATIEEVEALWKKFYPQEEFSYTFMNEYIESFYKSERRTAKLAGIATGMAIFISCLGLFGLATYMAGQRKKEVGIRKVLGASVWGITLLLSKEICKLVILAFVIATPIAIYVSQEWLTGFAYQIKLGPGLFISSGLVAILIAIITVSYQTIKTALANPVNSLRSE